MPDANDMALVREYATANSEPAFETLVRRHVSLVYSVALRQVCNPAQAEEITQAVFLILARKAARLRPDTVLAGWLHETARFASASFLRGELRRHRREQEAYVQSKLQESTADSAWEQLAPLLDEAIGQLGKADRNAVVLRFFQNKSAREIAAALNVHESAAQKRLNRAVEKLRAWFLKRGVAVSADALSGALSVNSVQGAPAHLAASVMAASAKGTAVSGSTLTLIKGALKIMAWTKAKTAIVVGVGILFTAGTTTITVKEIQNYRDGNYSWQVENPTPEMLDKLPPLVKIVPTKYPDKNTSRVVSLSVPELNQFKALGIGLHIEEVLRTAYDEPGHKHERIRIVAPTRISSPARYDFIVTLPSGGLEALQREIQKKLGLVGRFETIETNVLLLEVKYPASPGLQSSTVECEISPRQASGEISFVDEGFKTLAGCLENNFGMPVLDLTGLTNRHYYDLKWNQPNWQNRNLNGLKQALLDQLGLELVPSREPIKMLVVEKTK